MIDLRKNAGIKDFFFNKDDSMKDDIKDENESRGNRFNGKQAEDLLTLQARLTDTLLEYSDRLYDIIYDAAEDVQQEMLNEGLIEEQKILTDDDYLDNLDLERIFDKALPDITELMTNLQLFIIDEFVIKDDKEDERVKRLIDVFSNMEGIPFEFEEHVEIVDDFFFQYLIPISEAVFYGFEFV